MRTEGNRSTLVILALGGLWVVVSIAVVGLDRYAAWDEAVYLAKGLGDPASVNWGPQRALGMPTIACSRWDRNSHPAPSLIACFRVAMATRRSNWRLVASATEPSTLLPRPTASTTLTTTSTGSSYGQTGSNPRTTCRPVGRRGGQSARGPSCVRVERRARRTEVRVTRQLVGGGGAFSPSARRRN